MNSMIMAKQLTFAKKMKTNDNACGAESMKIEHEQGTVGKFQDFILMIFMAQFREIN